MKQNYILKSLGIGAVAGVRTMTAPAFVAQHHETSGKWIFRGLAMTELAVDKLPNTPDRIIPMQLIARATSGAASAAWLSDRKNEKGQIALSALLGAGGAIAATYATFHLRKWLGKKLGVKDFYLGLMEDALLLGAGTLLIRKREAVEPAYIEDLKQHFQHIA